MVKVRLEKLVVEGGFAFEGYKVGLQMYCVSEAFYKVCSRIYVALAVSGSGYEFFRFPRISWTANSLLTE
jgi:hypothetical protein